MSELENGVERCYDCEIDIINEKVCNECKEEFNLSHKCKLCNTLLDRIYDDSFIKIQISKELGSWDDWDHDEDLYFCCEFCYKKHIKPLFDKPIPPLQCSHCLKLKEIIIIDSHGLYYCLDCWKGRSI